MARSDLKKRLDELQGLIDAKRRADVYQPRSNWPPYLVSMRAAFSAELARQDGGNKYEWLLANLHRSPSAPLKPKFAAMVGDLDGCRELYELTRGGRP